MAALRAAHALRARPAEARDGDDGDPSPFTARGVLAAMRAAWEAETGRRALDGVRVVVQGAGKVGGGLARPARRRGRAGAG